MTSSHQDQQFISRVLASTDIVEVIAETVDLKPRGAAKMTFMGCCPFHADKSPSFSVSGDKQLYHCFGCDAGLNGKQGGDAITYVRRYHDFDFRQAVAFLADRAAIPVPPTWLNTNGKESLRTRSSPPEQTTRATLKAKAPSFVFESDRESSLTTEQRTSEMFTYMQRAHGLYRQCLAKSQNAVDYLLNKRGLSEDTINRYAIAYAPPGFDTLKQIYPVYGAHPRLLEVGLVKKSEESGHQYDFFRDRILFGIRDLQGRIVAYGGRRLQDKSTDESKDNSNIGPKYLNSPETPIFNKRQLLFGLFEALPAIKKTGTALVVEGYMDVVGLAEHGIDCAVASMGTAISNQQLTSLWQSGAKQVIFIMDGDEAGQKAMYRALEPILETFHPDQTIKFLTLENNMDPDEFVKLYGTAALETQLSNALDLELFVASYLRRWAQTSLDNGARQTRTVEQEVARLIGLIPEQFRSHPKAVRVASVAQQQIRQIAQEIAQGELQRTQQQEISVQLPRTIKQLLIAANRLPIVALNCTSILEELLDRSVPAHEVLYNQFNLAIGMGMGKDKGRKDAELDATARHVLECTRQIVYEFAIQSSTEFMATNLANGRISPQVHLEQLDKRVRMHKI